MIRALKILSIIIAGFAIIYGCNSGGSTELNPTITHIQPESGPPGTAVTIIGNDFSPNPSENNVTFDGNPATVHSATETEIETEVPEGIEPGASEIEVSVEGNTAFGLIFTVETMIKNRVVYTEWSNPDKIYTINPDGTQKALLFEESGVSQTDISPDGTKIVYSRGPVTGSDLYIIKADGTGKVQITTSGDGNNDPAWSPDGDQIVFSGEDSNGDIQLFIIDEDGSNREQITFGDLSPREPHWSMDGSQIVFDAFPLDNYEIFVVNADGTNPTQLTSDSGRDQDPVWSPDGSQIAFSSTRGTNRFDIYRMNSDGSNIQQITHNDNSNRNPAWSHDGSEITFDGFDGSFYNIYTIDANGIGSVNSVTSESEDERDPKWASEE